MDIWRKAGYPGINSTISKLFQYWHSNNQDKIRPFFCQVSAIETLVWLCDAPDSIDPELSEIRADIKKVCDKHNTGILRYATKMATGTGKTHVMGMIISWLALRDDKRTDILVMVPNLTVKSRLDVLIPNGEDPVYNDILPRNMRLPGNLHVSISNYQAFQIRSGLNIGGSVADKKTRDLITAGGKEPDEWTEAPADMLDRLLKSHKGASRITVINDEAHHCYLPEDPESKGGKDDVIKPRDAALWFSVLEYLKGENILGNVFDMSATPMFIAGSNRSGMELFPWIVSDYPLIEAIESGLTKIPRVPVKDLTGYDEPRFRNIYNYIRKAERRLRHDSMHEDVEDLLKRMQERYKDESKRYAEHGKIPVMIVVAYPIDNAKALYKHLAGYRNKDGSWHEGYEMFSNIKDGKPLSKPVTLLVTSDMDDLDDNEWKELAIEQETFFKGREKKERTEHIRKVFQTVGQRGQEGENIKCVVSVNMLTEGWDARTVTHIFGYRSFKSDLLCEQVAGRALRRSSFPVDGLMHGKLLQPEYADIFGIPFSFMQGTPPGTTDPNPSVHIETVEGRGGLRMYFPNIRSYLHNYEVATMKLDPVQVKPYRLDHSVKPIDIEIRGISGEPITSKDDIRESTAIYNLARNITEKYCQNTGKGTRSFFISALAAVHEWLEHEKVHCEDARLLAYRPNSLTAIKAIWEASTQDVVKPPVTPVFWDEGDPSQPHTVSTAGVSFDTTRIDNVYPEGGGISAKSELNKAACDSPEEATIAEMLDNHDDVEAWVRNDRIGWKIPYSDPKTGNWRDYYPDFVARLRGGKHHLVIEYKGQVTKDATLKEENTVDNWIPAVNESDDPACAGKWYYVFLDNSERMRNDIDRTIRRALA